MDPHGVPASSPNGRLRSICVNLPGTDDGQCGCPSRRAAAVEDVTELPGLVSAHPTLGHMTGSRFPLCAVAPAESGCVIGQQRAGFIANHRQGFGAGRRVALQRLMAPRRATYLDNFPAERVRLDTVDRSVR
jgi:hypothetical protein